MRVIVVLAFLSTIVGLVASLTIPENFNELVSRKGGSSSSRSRGHTPARASSPSRGKSPTPGRSSQGANRGNNRGSTRGSKSPTPGPSRPKSPSPKPPKLPVKYRGTADAKFKQYKIPKNSPEQAQIRKWHEDTVRAHVATHHPNAKEIHITKLVHKYGSSDDSHHITYEVKGADGRWIKNNGSHKNNSWHHAKVDSADIPQAYRDAVAAKGHTL